MMAESEESILRTRDRRIAHVVIFGTGRPQNGILISPSPEYTLNKDEFFEAIWPHVEYMNQIVPSHSRVIKELVLIEEPSLPFATTDKGTVREKITLELYRDRIEMAYNDLENKQSNDTDSLVFPSEFGQAEIRKFLRDALKVLSPSLTEVESATDLFEYGM